MKPKSPPTAPSRRRNNNNNINNRSSSPSPSDHDARGGVSRRLPLILKMIGALTVVYCFLYFYFLESTNILGILPPPAPQYCQKHQQQHDSVVCSRSDLFAFQITSWLALTICAIMGLYLWPKLSSSATDAAATIPIIPATPAGRIFATVPQAELLAAICFAFQAFDFMVSLTIPEHRTMIMMTHHFMAATVSWCAVQFGYLHYYGVFFLGLSEVSSCFLVFVDLAHYFPPTPGSVYDMVVGMLCAPLFAICFVWYRVVLWWPVSWRLFCDARAVLSSGQASRLRPGKEWVLYVFLGMNVPLGLLQLYWLTIILDEAQKIVL